MMRTLVALLRKRLSLAPLALVLMVALSGCGGAASTIPSGAVAQAAPSGLVESDTVDGIPVTLTVDPFKPGPNQFVVTTSEKGIAAVETQVVMLEMGHGAVLDMTQAGPGRYEATSPVIDMVGKWMLKVKLTTDAGEEKVVTFYGKVTSAR